MSRTAMGGAVVALAAVAAIVFASVAVHELDYAADHPFAYGPAKVIAWACGAGTLLSVSVGLLAIAMTRTDRA